MSNSALRVYRNPKEHQRVQLQELYFRELEDEHRMIELWDEEETVCGQVQS